MRSQSVLALVAFLMSSCSFTQKTSRQFLTEAEKTGGYDIIVVPGVPFEDGKWSRTMKGRVYWSKYLFDKGLARNIMYSGSAVYTPYTEAEIMRLYAVELGIPDSHIFTEDKAEHSTENIYYSYQKARMLGFEKIALASDPFQTKMLRRYATKVIDPDIGFLPMVYDSLVLLEPVMVDPEIPHDQARIDDFVPLTERESFRERFRGTRGLKVDTTLYQ